MILKTKKQMIEFITKATTVPKDCLGYDYLYYGKKQRAILEFQNKTTKAPVYALIICQPAPYTKYKKFNVNLETWKTVYSPMYDEVKFITTDGDAATSTAEEFLEILQNL